MIDKLEKLKEVRDRFYRGSESIEDKIWLLETARKAIVEANSYRNQNIRIKRTLGKFTFKNEMTRFKELWESKDMNENFNTATLIEQFLDEISKQNPDL